MQDQRTTMGGDALSAGDDATRQSMRRDDEMAPTEGKPVPERVRDVEADNDYWTNEGPGPKVMAADTLQGDVVYNQADEKLGEADDGRSDLGRAGARFL